jgi:hypothetical protein
MAGGRLRVDHHAAVVADDDSGIRIALRRIGVEPVAELVERDRLRAGIGGGGEGLGTFSSLQNGGQGLEAAKPDAPGSDRRSREPVAGKPLEEAGQCNAALQPGERHADALMRALREGQVPVGLAGEIEAVGLGELLGVAIAGTDAQGDAAAGGQVMTAERHPHRGHPVAELVGAFEAQEFLDRGADQRGFGLEARAFAGPGYQQFEAVADQVRRGLVPGIEDEDAVLQQFASPSAARRPASPRDQPRQHVTCSGSPGRLADARATSGFEIGDELASPRALPRVHLRRRQHRLQRAEDGQRPVAQRPSLGVRHGEQVADHFDRDRRGEILDQVDRGPSARPSGPAAWSTSVSTNEASIACDGARGERAGKDQPPHAGMQRRIVEHQARRVVLEEWRVCPYFGPNSTLLVRRDSCARVLVDRLEVGMACQEPPTRRA